MANKFLLHFPPEAIRAALSQNPSEPYSELAATVSLALDIDIGRSKSIRDYARIWHWNRGKVHREMPGLKKDAEDWLSWYGKKGETSCDSSVTAVGQQRDSRVTKKQRKSNIIDAERDNVVTEVGQSCDNGVTQTIQNSELQNSEEEYSLTSFENNTEQTANFAKQDFHEPKITTLSTLESDSASKKWNDFDVTMTVNLETVLLKRGNIDSQLSDAQRDKWSDEFRKLREIDEKPEKLIRGVLTWLVSVDDWWIDSGNFNSALKLRRKDKDGQTYFKRFELSARRHYHETSGRSANGQSIAETMAARF